MINLLPPGKKKELFLEQVRRLVLVLGGIAVISLVCLLFVLLAVKFYILAEIVSQKSIFSGVKPNGFSETKEIIVRYNKILPSIADFYKNKNYFGDVLKQIIDEAPEAVSVLNVSLNDEGKGSIKVAVSGTCGSRKDLIVFKNTIENDKKIKNSQFSPDSWIKEKNASFNLTFEFLNEK